MKAFVLGHPIEHSLSPVLHSAAYEVLGADILYGRRDTQVHELASRFQELQAPGDLRGLSVTMPLKAAMVGEVDELTDFARSVGVVNTVYWRAGKAIGHNTDVSGIVNALHHAGAQFENTGVPAILGGGGTATAAVAALVSMGARSIDVFVRDPQRAQGVQDVADRLGAQIRYRAIESYAEHYGSYEVTISTLPAGAADQFASKLAGELRGAVLLDVSYDPWPSKIAHAFEAAGGTIVSGKEMLMYQGYEQVRLFAPDEFAEAAGRELEVLNAMCRALDLAERQTLPLEIERL